MKTLPILIVLNLVALGLIVLLFVGQRDLEARIASLQPDAGAPEPDSSLGMNAGELDLFRKRVRRALELNSQEDELRRASDAVRKLAEAGRIAPLSSEQEERVARTLIASDLAFPEIARRMRERHDIGQMTIAQRREAMQAEVRRIRDDVQKSLEEIVPPADAAVIVEDRHPTPRKRTQAR